MLDRTRKEIISSSSHAPETAIDAYVPTARADKAYIRSKVLRDGLNLGLRSHEELTKLANHSALILAKELMMLTPGDVLKVSRAAIGLSFSGEYVIVENEGSLAVKKLGIWVYPMPNRGAVSVLQDWDWIRVYGIELQVPLPPARSHLSNTDLSEYSFSNSGAAFHGCNFYPTAEEQVMARYLEFRTMPVQKIEVPPANPLKIRGKNFGGYMTSETRDTIAELRAVDDLTFMINNIAGSSPVEYLASARVWADTDPIIATLLPWGTRLRVGGVGGKIVEISPQASDKPQEKK